MKSGIGYLFILLALGVVLSYARPNMELPREKRGGGITRHHLEQQHYPPPCAALICDKKKREVHVESEDTNEGNQKTLESPLFDKSPDSDSSRQKRGISIGGNNEGDIHAPCTAVVCNKKKRETQMNTENVEASETNVQIPENPDFDQNSKLDSEKAEVSINLSDPDISREKRSITIGGDNSGDINAPCTAVVCNKKKRSVNNGRIHAPNSNVFIPGDNNKDINAPCTGLFCDRKKRSIKIGGNNSGDIHAPCTAVVCNKKKRSVNIGKDNDGTIYAPKNPVNIGGDNNGKIDSDPDIVKIGGRNNGRVRDPKANNHFNF